MPELNKTKIVSFFLAVLVLVIILTPHRAISTGPGEELTNEASDKDREYDVPLIVRAIFLSVIIYIGAGLISIFLLTLLNKVYPKVNPGKYSTIAPFLALVFELYLIYGDYRKWYEDYIRIKGKEPNVSLHLKVFFYDGELWLTLFCTVILSIIVYCKEQNSSPPKKIASMEEIEKILNNWQERQRGSTKNTDDQKSET